VQRFHGLEVVLIEPDPAFSLPHTDIELMRLKLKLTPGQRLHAMLDARELVIGAIRARLRAEHPDLSVPELNLKVFEEIERVKRFPQPPRFLR